MYRSLVIGLGTQGYKRKLHAGCGYVGSVDTVNPEADFKNIEDVPLKDYDIGLVCTPDNTNYQIIKFLLNNKKHVLVEKPFMPNNLENIKEIEKISNKNKVVFYTAYNHRFEPHFIKMKNLIESRKLGKLYYCRMFYGNGTARQVKNSKWKDKGSGVLTDLGSHLLDTCQFWFKEKVGEFQIQSNSSFENKSADHIILKSKCSELLIQLEITLCMWRNHFTCDILAEKGSAHISSLCKWGPSKFSFRERVLPSGVPIENTTVIRSPDPTWSNEYQYFLNLIDQKQKNNLDTDIWLYNVMKNLEKEMFNE